MIRPLTIPPTAEQAARYRNPARVRIFYENLLRMGITFTVEPDGRIVGHGRGMSPLLQTEIDHRAELLRELVRRG